MADAVGNYRASNLAAGAYRVTGYPGPGDAFGSVSYTGVAVGAPGTVTTRNIVLGPAPSPPPEGTTIGPRIDDDPEGVPSAYWGDPLDLSTKGCPNGTAHYTVVLEGRVVREGDLAETPPGSGTFTGQIPALRPDHGTGEIRVQFSDCGGAPADDVDFGIYIDPSGVVRDAAGNLVPDAEVTLYRSASADGPFFEVPDGSAVMSPSNRRNPDFTDGNGHFGWDVVAGFYVVEAENGEDCTGRSAVLSIPPPVTDLDIRLSCAPPPPDGPVLIGNPPPPPAVPAATPRKLAKLGKVKLLKGKTPVGQGLLREGGEDGVRRQGLAEDRQEGGRQPELQEAQARQVGHREGEAVQEGPQAGPQGQEGQEGEDRRPHHRQGRGGQGRDREPHGEGQALSRGDGPGAARPARQAACSRRRLASAPMPSSSAASAPPA